MVELESIVLTERIYHAMEELQKTQEYAAERERRRNTQPYEGDDRRKRASIEQPVDNPDSPELPVSGEDGTGRR
jgi:IS5 family transposase